MDNTKLIEQCTEAGLNKREYGAWLDFSLRFAAKHGCDFVASLNNPYFLRETFYFSVDKEERELLSSNNYYKTLKFIKYTADKLNVVDITVPSYKDVLLIGEAVYTSLDEIINYIDICGRKNVPSYTSKDGFSRTKVILILTWYGFSLEELSELKKENVEFFKDQQGLLCRIKKLDGIVVIPHKYAGIIKIHYESNYVHTFEGLTPYFKTPLYLIATTNGEQCSPQRIKNTIARFNEMSTEKLKLKQVRRSGEFERIETQGIPVREFYKGKSYKQLIEYEAFYELWLQTKKNKK